MTTQWNEKTTALYETAFHLGQKYGKTETTSNNARNKAMIAAVEFVHSIPASERNSDAVNAALAAITEGWHKDTARKFNRVVKDARIHQIVDDHDGDVEKAMKSIKADAPKAADFLGACRKITDKRQDGEESKPTKPVEVSPDGQAQAKMLKAWYASMRSDLSEKDVNEAVAMAIIPLEKLNTAPVKPAIVLGNQSTGTNG